MNHPLPPTTDSAVSVTCIVYTADTFVSNYTVKLYCVTKKSLLHGIALTSRMRVRRSFLGAPPLNPGPGPAGSEKDIAGRAGGGVSRSCLFTDTVRIPVQTQVFRSCMHGS